MSKNKNHSKRYVEKSSTNPRYRLKPDEAQIIYQYRRAKEECVITLPTIVKLPFVINEGSVLHEIKPSVFARFLRIVCALLWFTWEKITLSVLLNSITAYCLIFFIF